MSSKQWIALAAWVLVPFAAFAQQKQSQYAPTDANAPVDTVRYESAFKSYRVSGDESPSPGKVWRAANEEMGKLGGHAGQMKSEGATPAAALVAAPATSSAPSDAPAKQGGAVDHSKHH